MSRNVIKTSI